MIKNEYNGLLYPSDKAQTLAEAIRWLISQESNILELKKLLEICGILSAGAAYKENCCQNRKV